MSRNWDGLRSVRRAKLERTPCVPFEPLPAFKSTLPERHTDPDPDYNLPDSRGRPISLPRVSILEKDEA